MVPLPSNRKTDMGKHDACIERRRSVLSGGAPPFTFVQNSSAPHFSIMFTYYYCIWLLPVSDRSNLIYRGEFHADSWQHACSFAHECLENWGSVLDECAVSLSPRKNDPYPKFLYFPES